MKPLAAIALLTLTGCGVDVSNHGEIRWAKDVCANNGGLKAMRVYKITTAEAFCHNGAHFNQSRKTWLKYSQENTHALN